MSFQTVRLLLLAGGLISASSLSIGSQISSATQREATQAAPVAVDSRHFTGAEASASPLSFARQLAEIDIDRLYWRSFEHIDPLPVESAAATSGARHVVVIDPGHGGSDPGARGVNAVLEKHLTLDIARRAALFLSEIDDIDVVLTRQRDRGLSRQARVERIRASGADLLLSLHLNNLPQAHVNLVETYYAGLANLAESRAVQRAEQLGLNIDRDMLIPVAGQGDTDLKLAAASKDLATILQRRLFDEVSRDAPGVTNAGVKTDTLYVLTRSGIPGALVELGCLSNPHEATRMTSEAWRNRLAAALADSVREYFRSGNADGVPL